MDLGKDTVTKSQLLITVEDIGRQLDQQHGVDILILDFAKAFDMVPHRRLPNKTEILWSKRKNIKLDTKLACTKAPMVIVDGKKSRHVPVKSGIPQGTVLGPLHFLIYINDIGDNITSSLRLFADDCLLYRRTDTKNDAVNLQRDLDTIVKLSEMANEFQSH